MLWNQTEEDIYERWRDDGPQALAWDPTRTVPDVGTVAEEMDVFMTALHDGGYDARLINVDDELERVFGAIRLYRPDAIFNLVEYFHDEPNQEAYIAGVYELMGYQYTGNRPVTLANCQNKYRTKILLEGADLPTSPFFLAKPGQPISEDHELDYPVIVKPAFEDASGGIEPSSVVHDLPALITQAQKIWKEFEMPALVEEYVEGREIHAAVLGDQKLEVLPLFEMEFDDSEFNPDEEWRPQIISFRAKWDPHSKDFYSMDSVCPAQDLDPETEQYIREVALGAFKALGCRDYARIDMRVDDDGEVYILEVNPNPDLVEGTAYVQCTAASGRTYSEAICTIAELAIERGRKAKAKAKQAEALLRAGLPTDTLLREWHLQKTGVLPTERTGEDAAPWDATAVSVAAAAAAAAQSGVGVTAADPVAIGAGLASADVRGPDSLGGSLAGSGLSAADDGGPAGAQTSPGADSAGSDAVSEEPASAESEPDTATDASRTDGEP